MLRRIVVTVAIVEVLVCLVPIEVAGIIRCSALSSLVADTSQMGDQKRDAGVLHKLMQAGACHSAAVRQILRKSERGKAL